MFSTELTAVLRNVGWSPERKVSAATWVKNMMVEKLAPFPLAITVMENFGGLRLPPIKRETFKIRTVSLYFDSEIPGGKASLAFVSPWEKKLGLQLNPIAELSNGHAALLIAEDGRVFSIFDDCLDFYGDSLEEALENSIVFGYRRPREVGTINNP